MKKLLAAYLKNSARVWFTGSSWFEPLLPDSLVISLDDLDAGRWESTLPADPKRVKSVLDNVRRAAGEQVRRRFTLTVTCVVTPGRVDAARRVRDFVYESGAQFSAQYLSVKRVPSPELTADPEYAAFMGSCWLTREQDAASPGASSTWRAREPARRRPVRRRLRRTSTGWVGSPTHAGSYPITFWWTYWLPDRCGTCCAKRRAAGLHPSEDCPRCGERCYVEISSLVRQPTSLAREAIHDRAATR